MIAILKVGSEDFDYPTKIRKNVSELPEGFEELITEEQLVTMISDNQAAWQAWKIEQEQAVSIQDQKQKFITMKKKWEEIAYDLSVENDALGITEAGKSKEVADAFKDVVYYLGVNTPTEALKSLVAIQPIPVFLEQDKLTALITKFQGILLELWGE